jgi:hypothetical protein
LPFPPAQMRQTVAAAFGVEIDLVQMGPQQLQGEPVPFAEVTGVERKNAIRRFRPGGPGNGTKRLYRTVASRRSRS